MLLAQGVWKTKHKTKSKERTLLLRTDAICGLLQQYKHAVHRNKLEFDREGGKNGNIFLFLFFVYRCSSCFALNTRTVKQWNLVKLSNEIVPSHIFPYVRS